jgi:glycerol uptake facilitator-like aquaporin
MIRLRGWRPEATRGPARFKPALRHTSNAKLNKPVDAHGADRATLGRHAVYEGVLTTLLLFGIVTFVRWFVGPSPISRAVPDIHLEVAVVGASVAVLVTPLILSPSGGAPSGAHLNPAISLAMWRDRVFPVTSADA